MMRKFKLMAERVGFEPTVPLTVHTLSKRAPRTLRLTPSFFHNGILTQQESTVNMNCDQFESTIWTQKRTLKRESGSLPSIAHFKRDTKGDFKSAWS